MEYPVRNNIPYEEIENGALILLLLRASKTWEELCGRYAYADPAQIKTNTNTFSLLKKLFEMRDLELISFEDKEWNAVQVKLRPARAPATGHPWVGATRGEKSPPRSRGTEPQGSG